MPNLGPTELIIIAVVLILLFGAKKLPDAARSLGRSMRIFKSEVKEMKNDDEQPEVPEQQAIQQAPQAQPQHPFVQQPPQQSPQAQPQQYQQQPQAQPQDHQQYPPQQPGTGEQR
ncbi:Sec-independent protein translocase subunit TatA [Corynebacterium hansenii]|uniref:Sec-independent protein translocase protein TatA n=1 Tax=Corynebacterium hansenii TaxID=394964 RepID=A0ABV7ZRM2_9CORY|nr:Sec-independent protein translocase subunit TatA [Corynebacterium hansenii]WJZ00043.1 Sec-independent protein translocase protein TatAy [Corynebacterium hansenii]